MVSVDSLQSGTFRVHARKIFLCRKHRNRRPKIVICLMEMLRTIVLQNRYHTLYGGRHQIHHNRLDRFFNRLKRKDVDLVFFFGSNDNNSESDAILMKDLDGKYSQSTKVLDAIDAGESIAIPYKSRRSILGLNAYQIATKYGELHTDYDYMNKAIVQYARKNEDVIAVIGADSDFLLLQMDTIQLWNFNSKDFDSNRLKCVAYDQSKVLSHLNLSKDQFLLLTTVLLAQDNEKSFKQAMKRNRRIGDGAMKSIVENVSSMLRNEWTLDSPIDFSKFSEVLSNSSHFAESLRAAYDRHYVPNEDAINEQLKSLNVDGVDDRVTPEEMLKKNKVLHTLLTGQTMRVNLHFIDLRPWSNGKIFTILYRDVYQRAMGILFNKQRNERITLPFYTKMSHHSPVELIDFEAEFPPGQKQGTGVPLVQLFFVKFL